MTSVLTVDFESRSAVDLKRTGVHVYATDASTDIWCAAWAIDDEPVQLWTPGSPPPKSLVDHVTSGGLCAAWNAAFEITIWKHILAPRYGFPDPRLDQWRCSMVAACAMSLPGSLENAAGAIGIDIGKDMAGRRLMLTMSAPRRPRKGELPGLYWWDDEERRNRLYAYCKNDVEVERAIRKRLVALRESEQKLWQFDQVVNERGVHVDEKLCRRALAIVEYATKRLDRQMAAATAFEVSACSNLNALKAWVKREGVACDALDKEALTDLLSRDDLPEAVRTALSIRQEASKASVAKINALLTGMSSDDRARGLLQFMATITGRWAGRRFQPQNLRRPGYLPSGAPETDVDDAIDTILTLPTERAVQRLEMLYGPILTTISDCLRGMISAAPGKVIRAADFSNIEGRVIAWLAGETWKCDAFRAYDAGEGPDLYLVTAADILGVPVSSLNKKSPERQSHGKVPELACGYQGGLGAFQAMARVYGVTIEDELAIRIVKQWRARHPNIVQFWRDLEAAAFEAVRNPKTTVSVGATRFRMVGSFLWMQIPSGRAICFPYPAIAWKAMPWDKSEPEWVPCNTQEEASGHGEKLVEYRPETQRALVYVPAWKEVVSFKGVDSFTRKWSTQYLYGGQIANYVTQGTARDVMAAAMLRVEAAGYPVILTVHDEVVCECDADHGSDEDFERMMVELPPWAVGLPVAAEAWSGDRYRK